MSAVGDEEIMMIGKLLPRKEKNIVLTIHFIAESTEKTYELSWLATLGLEKGQRSIKGKLITKKTDLVLVWQQEGRLLVYLRP